MRKSGMPVPALDRRPAPPFEYRYYLRMFKILNRDRRIDGMGGFGYIPITAFESYCNLFGITSYEDRDRLLGMMHRLDDTFVEYQAERAAKKTGS